MEKGLKIILKAIAAGEEVAELALAKLESKLEQNERARDTRSDQ